MTDEILLALLNDNVKANELRTDGTYVRRKAAKGKPTQQAQLTFRQLTRKPAVTSAPPAAGV